MFYRLCFLLCVLSVLSCKPKLINQETVSKEAAVIPLGLMIESVIEGEILGLKLNEPGGLAGGKSGSLFLIDAGNDRVIRFDEGLIPRSDTKGYGGDEGTLDRPAYAVLDNSLNLIVADPGNRRLVWFDRQLHFADELSLTDEEDPLKYGEVSSVGVTGYGELWVVDWEMGRIAVFENTGNFVSFIGDFGYTGGQLMKPEKIIADEHDGFYVCDAGNGRLVHYDGYGNFQDQITDEIISYPISAALDKNGKWILDGSSGRLVFFDNNNQQQFVTGPLIVGSGIPLNKPSDILTLSDNRLLISDTGNNRMLVCRIFYD